MGTNEIPFGGIMPYIGIPLTMKEKVRLANPFHSLIRIDGKRIYPGKIIITVIIIAILKKKERILSNIIGSLTSVAELINFKTF